MGVLLGSIYGGAALFFSWSFLRLFSGFSFPFLILFLYFSYTFLLLLKKRKDKKRREKTKKRQEKTRKDQEKPGAKTVRESSDSFDPPKGSFQYNPSSRQCVTWSDSRSRIAIVAVGNLFGFDLNYENSRFLVLCRVSWVQTESRERLA